MLALYAYTPMLRFPGSAVTHRKDNFLEHLHFYYRSVLIMAFIKLFLSTVEKYENYIKLFEQKLSEVKEESASAKQALVSERAQLEESLLEARRERDQALAEYEKVKKKKKNQNTVKNRGSVNNSSQVFSDYEYISELSLKKKKYIHQKTCTVTRSFKEFIFPKNLVN